MVSVSAGTRFSLCLDDTGCIWSWGCAIWGCLGHGTDRRDEPTPRRIETFSSPSSPLVMAIAAGTRHCLALDREGALFSWGYGRDGALGLGDALQRNSPTRVTPLVNYDGNSSSGGMEQSHHNSLSSSSSSSSSLSSPPHVVVVAAAAGGRHSLVVTADGRLFSSGVRMKPNLVFVKEN